MGIGPFSLGINRPRREADHSASSAELENGGAVPPIRVRGVVRNYARRDLGLLNGACNIALFCSVLCTDRGGGGTL
jgi:hypothetical protein